ncbi:MAG TPA: hypothetical protein VER33_16580, partial [Polyangiaceae bacterium]|nr:hypothetical protein [Polyangiaceae bacterium]
MTRLLLKVVRPLVPFVLASVCVECAGGDYSIGGENAGGTQAAGEGGSAGRTAGSGDGSSGERNGATGGEGTLAEPAGGTGGQPLSGASGGEADDGGSGGNNGGTGPGSGGAGDGGAGCTPRVLTRCLRPSFPLGGQDPSLETPARVALEGVSALNAVNSRDQMVGAGPMGCGGTRALMFEDGNALSLLAELDHTYSEALDINDHGTVVGQVSFDVTPDPAEMVPFVWSDGVTLLLSQERGLRPVAVNDHDQVLLLPEAPALGGFLWEDGELTDLAIAAEPHGVTPHGMNNLGQVVGDLITESGVSGFLWEEGSIQELADFSSIRAINDAGQMAGFSRSRQAALWDGATLLLLGGPPGPREFDAPVAITAEGAVLGDSYVYSQGVLSPLTGRV